MDISIHPILQYITLPKYFPSKAGPRSLGSLSYANDKYIRSVHLPPLSPEHVSG